MRGQNRTLTTGLVHTFLPHVHLTTGGDFTLRGFFLGHLHRVDVLDSIQGHVDDVAKTEDSRPDL